jgi:hypothetical protein
MLIYHFVEWKPTSILTFQKITVEFIWIVIKGQIFWVELDEAKSEISCFVTPKGLNMIDINSDHMTVLFMHYLIMLYQLTQSSFAEIGDSEWTIKIMAKFTEWIRKFVSSLSTKNCHRYI